MAEQQFTALAELVEDWAIKKSQHVKGPYTSGDFVTHELNRIFTPGGWSFTILRGPKVVTINEANAYVRLVGRLSVRFRDGTEAHQDDIGIWPLKATKAREGGVLQDTAPERYETAEKAARTDCLKNAARNLGTCFAPLSDLELVAAKKRADYENSYEPIAQSTEDSITELYGPDTLPETPPEPEATEGPKETPSTSQESPPTSEKPNWSWFWMALKNQGYEPDDVHKLGGFTSVKQWLSDNPGKTLPDALNEIVSQLKDTGQTTLEQSVEEVYGT